LQKKYDGAAGDDDSVLALVADPLRIQPGRWAGSLFGDRPRVREAVPVPGGDGHLRQLRRAASAVEREPPGAGGVLLRHGGGPGVCGGFGTWGRGVRGRAWGQVDGDMAGAGAEDVAVRGATAQRQGAEAAAAPAVSGGAVQRLDRRETGAGGRPHLYPREVSIRLSGKPFVLFLPS
jgi:hypothetical protein